MIGNLKYKVHSITFKIYIVKVYQDFILRGLSYLHSIKNRVVVTQWADGIKVNSICCRIQPVLDLLVFGALLGEDLRQA